MQKSESFRLSALLSFSGGLQDAYTYNMRNGVFANAQTGNVVLMSQNFMQGNWYKGLHYMIPLVSFAAGIFLAERIESRFKNSTKIHWRQIILVIEFILLLAVGFMPASFNMVANVLVSFSCAMQVQTFRKVHGYGYASTMCIGNLRSGMAAVAEYLHDRQRASLVRAKYYFGVILAFAIGAGIGGNLSPVLHERAIWVCCVLLAFAFWLMNWKGREGAKA